MSRTVNQKFGAEFFTLAHAFGGIIVRIALAMLAPAFILGGTSAHAGGPKLFKNAQMDELNQFMATDVFGANDPAAVRFECSYGNTTIPDARVMQSCESTHAGITASTAVAGRQLLSIVLTFDPKVSKAAIRSAVQKVLVMYERTGDDPVKVATADGIALAKLSVNHFWEDGFTDSFDGTATLKIDRIRGQTVFRLHEGD